MNIWLTNYIGDKQSNTVFLAIIKASFINFWAKIK